MITRFDVLRFLALYGFWLLLSWRRDPVFWVLGLVVAAGVTAAFSPISRSVLSAVPRPTPWHRMPPVALRAALYVVWLLSRVVVASVQVARVVLDPRLPIDPCALRFRTGLSSPAARTVLASSITLTPGTVTVEVVGDELVVHAMFPGAADDLVSGHIQSRIAAVFSEPPQPAPDVTWITDREVLG